MNKKALKRLLNKWSQSRHRCNWDTFMQRAISEDKKDAEDLADFCYGEGWECLADVLRDRKRRE